MCVFINVCPLGESNGASAERPILQNRVVCNAPNNAALSDRHLNKIKRRALPVSHRECAGAVQKAEDAGVARIKYSANQASGRNQCFFHLIHDCDTHNRYTPSIFYAAPPPPTCVLCLKRNPFYRPVLQQFINLLRTDRFFGCCCLRRRCSVRATVIADCLRSSLPADALLLLHPSACPSAIRQTLARRKNKFGSRVNQLAARPN